MTDYKKRLVELDEILKHLSKDDYEKIPEWLIKGIKDNKDQTYIWNFDETKTLKEQNINRDTIVMLSLINTEYLLTEEQKQLMEEFYKLNSKKLEKECSQNDGSTLFQNEIISDSQNINCDINDKKTNISVHKDNLFKRMLNKIIKFKKTQNM